MSYENPDNLKTVADALSVSIKKSNLFTKEKGEGIAADEKIRNAAFSEEVLQGNNSTPIELGSDRLVVLRMLEHKVAARRTLDEVKPEVITVLSTEKAKQQSIEKAKQIKSRLVAGEPIQKVAADNKLEVKTQAGLTRNKTGVIPEPLSNAIFKAAKPVGDKPSIFVTALPSGEQVVVSLSKVKDGVMSDDDKKQLALATKNIAKAFAQTEFSAVVSSLQAEADISVKGK
jgi:peptidyl-prolyl cis-trans isomerase D